MNQILRLIAGCFALSMLCGQAYATSPFGPSTLAAWVQYTANGVEARAVVTGNCPEITIDGRDIPMSLRAEPTSEHPNYVCAATLPRHTRAVELNGQALPVPVKNPKRIVVVGDTGCRLSEGHGLYQECDNDAIWPFAWVARSIAKYKPDLIIYTGDYIYREAACPDNNNGCVGSPWGDNEATWTSDWLDPAHPIHLAAPMILVRGNHETCSRAGKGWFRYLDAFGHPDTCIDNTRAWSVALGRLDVGVMDTARVEDADKNPLTALFAAQLEELKPQLGRNAWIATHRPFWGFGADDDSGELVRPTEALQDAADRVGLPGGANLIISAHIHLAEIISFDGDRPPQLVVANGGTQLVPRVRPPKVIHGMKIAEELVLYQYGFVSMEPMGKSRRWNIAFRDVEGRILESCRLNKKGTDCRKPLQGSASKFDTKH